MEANLSNRSLRSVPGIPWPLAALLSAECVLLAAGAVLLPTHEPGIWKIVVAVIHVALLLLCFAYYRRARHADELLVGYCIAGVASGLIYLLYKIAAGIGGLVSRSDVFLAVEVITLFALFLAMRSTAAKEWFKRAGD